MYKTIDLCAGIGGIRRGFELTGQFENVLSAEIDRYACQMYEHLYDENPQNDVTDEDFKLQVEKINYDILLAGFPCQSFSRAGNEEGFLDKTRGTIFFDLADIIKRTRPKAFMLENVDNLLSHDKGNTFKTILKILIDELNYKVIGAEKDEDGEITFHRQNFLRNSRDFGLPQNRPRVYIMGFNADNFTPELINELNKKSLPTHRAKPPILQTLVDALEQKAEPKYYLSQGYVETLEKHKSRHKEKKNGFGYIVLNLPNEEKAYSNALLATGGSGKERNLIYDYNEEIPGMVVGSKKTPLNDQHIRLMTPNEWAKLQGFLGYAFIDKNTGEDHFSYPDKLSDAQKYKQFGNSVTIPAIEEMANFMLECFDIIDNFKKQEIEAVQMSLFNHE